MNQDSRAVVYDQGLRLEAYRFTGIQRPFPNHFHNYYVIGLMEGGRRAMTCRQQTYETGPGDLILLNPGDNHACTQQDDGCLDYRALNIDPSVMLDWAEVLTGNRVLPRFSPAVLRDADLAQALRTLHQGILSEASAPEKEAGFLSLLRQLIQHYSSPGSQALPPCREEVERACAFMETHFAQRLSLDQICRQAGLSKSALLRAFPKAKGVTPYCYLENIRIGQAKQLLEQGVPPAEAALRTGFVDQSHFTNYFSRFLGLPPGAYRARAEAGKEEGAP